MWKHNLDHKCKKSRYHMVSQHSLRSYALVEHLGVNWQLDFLEIGLYNFIEESTTNGLNRNVMRIQHVFRWLREMRSIPFFQIRMGILMVFSRFLKIWQTFYFGVFSHQDDCSFCWSLWESHIYINFFILTNGYLYR